MEQERWIEVGNTRVSDELKEKIKKGEEVEINFIVKDGFIKESTIIASGDGIIGFLSFMFYQILSNNRHMNLERLMEMCAISLSTAHEQMEEKEAGGKN